MPVIFIPTSPAVVPELGRSDSDSAQLLGSALSLIDVVRADHPGASITLLGSHSPENFTAHTGSFRAWGAPDVEVGEGNHLAELVMRYVLGKVDEPVSVAQELTNPDDIILYGLDGPAALSDQAPLSLLPGAQARHEWCQSLLAGEEVTWPDDVQELAADGIVEPELWWQLKDVRPIGAKVLAASDEHGVGRYLALWEGWEKR